jgi:hypothetical protein
MLNKLKFRSNLASRAGMLMAISSIFFLATACGTTVAPASNPTAASESVPATTVAAVVPTQESAPVNPSSKAPDACSLLTQEDVSKVLGKPVDTAVVSGMGGVCTYTSKNLSIDFTIAGHSGGLKAMKTTLERLGDLALVVPGLGDQAFYNTNSANALLVLKGDAEYMFGMSDVNYQPLDPAVVQATEKAMAEQLLSKLH